MAQAIATAWLKRSAVKAKRQSVPATMAKLHEELRHRGVTGSIYDSCLLLEGSQGPPGLLDPHERYWKITAAGENYGGNYA